MKQYTTIDGSPVSINQTTVCYMQESGDNTLVSFFGGSTLLIKERYSVVAEIEPEDKTVGFGTPHKAT